MMKLFFITAACLFTMLSAYPQTAGSSLASAADGNYVFSKAEITLYNYHTKATVLAQNFADTASLKAFSAFSFPMQPLFLSASINSGNLTFCKLWNNRREYSVEEEGRKMVAFNSSDEDGRAELFPQPYYFAPYTLNIAGNTATFTFTVLYGSSAYSFPLEGKVVIMLVKN